MQPLEYPLPCKKRADSLCQSLRARLKESLEYLIEINKKELGEYYILWKKSLSSIQLDMKTSSIFYSLNSLLHYNTTIGEVASIAPYIIDLPIYNLLNDNVKFLNYSEDELHKSKGLLQKKYILFDLPANANIESADINASEQIKKLVEEALVLIATVDKDYSQEMLTFVSEVMILKSDFLKAGSSFDLFGMIYINSSNANQSLIHMVDLLVHEAAHYYLYSLSVDDPLVLNDYDETYFSPIKGRNRPMVGIYHAAFVLFRVLKFLSLLTNQENNNIAIIQAQDRKEIATLNIKYSKIVAESLETIEKFGKLTELGKKLIEATKQEFLALTFEESPA